jgi:hypothetical protein
MAKVRSGLKQNSPIGAFILMRCCVGVKNGAFGRLNFDKHDGQDRELKEGLIAKRVMAFDLDCMNRLNADQVEPDSGQG